LGCGCGWCAVTAPDFAVDHRGTNGLFRLLVRRVDAGVPEVNNCRRC
jgi:hypothetical protein